MAVTNEQNVRHSQLMPRVIRQSSQAIILAPQPGQNLVDHNDQTVDDDLSSTVFDLTRILEQSAGGFGGSLFNTSFFSQTQQQHQRQQTPSFQQLQSAGDFGFQAPFSTP
ncbi:hypothetical protein EV1_007798 [Malus domestica]